MHLGCGARYTALQGEHSALQAEHTALQDANTVLRRCLEASGALRREAVLAQEHRLRFEKVCARHPVRGARRDQLSRPSLGILGVVPYCAFKSPKRFHL